MLSPDPESTVQKKRFQLLRSSTTDSESSSPQARWDHLRQHILPSSRRPATPSSASPLTSRFSASTPHLPSTTHAASSTTPVIARPPSRSTTPKPSGSRLAFAATKLGFKQVVDHVREAAVDENRRFGEDVLKACWASRSVDPAFHGLKGRGVPGMNVDHFIGSGYFYPSAHGRTKTTMSSFASSSVSIAVPATPSASGLRTGSSQISALSAGSGGVSGNNSSSSTATTAATAMVTPTIKHLHSILWQSSGTSSSTLRSVYLPHEPLVLSSLLLPFVSPVGSEARVEEERWLAIDAFEVLVKSFEPASELTSAERCTWCTQAVSALVTPSPLRSRILTQLWSLTEPAENKHIVVTPECIKTIASAVVILFPIISPSPSYPQNQSHYPYQADPARQAPDQQVNKDIDIVKEILDHLRMGGIIDEDACELEYGMKKKKSENSELFWDAERDSAEMMRKLMVSEASLACLEVCEMGEKIYLINNVVQEYWEPLSQIAVTPIQKSILSNRIKLFCNGVLEGLVCAPAYEMRYDLRNTVMNNIVKILQAIVIPELTSILGSSPIASFAKSASASSPSNTAPGKGKGKERVKGKGRAEVRTRQQRTESAFSVFGGEGVEKTEEEAKKAVIRTLLELVCCIEIDNGGGGYSARMVFPPAIDRFEKGKWARDAIENWFVSSSGVVSPPLLLLEEEDEGKEEGEEEWRLYWRSSLKQMLQQFVMNAEWKAVVRVLTGIVEKMGDNTRMEIFKSVFGTLIDRIIQDPPPTSLLITSPHSSSHHPGGLHSRSSSYQSDISLPPILSSLSTTPTVSLTTLLQTLSTVVPTIFFKPLFSLSAMNMKSEFSILSISNALGNVYGLAGVVKDWWVRDDEMISVALMSDIHGGGRKKGGDERKGKRSSSLAGRRGGDDVEESGRGAGGERLGQTCVLVELVNKLRVIRRLRDGLQASGGNTEGIVKLLGSETARLNLMKFVTGLEVRLAVLIEAREKSQIISPTQRMLYCILFREIRLLTRSLRPVPWLGVVLRWFEQYFNDWVDGNEWDEGIENVVEEIKEVYSLAKGSVGSFKNRRTTFMVPGSTAPTTATSENNTTGEEEFSIPEMLNETLKFVNSLTRGFVPRVVKLLVTVSTLLGSQDWARVAPIVWRSRLLLDSESSFSVEGKKKNDMRCLMPSVCYLVMQCAEKNALGFRGMAEVDMRSSDDTTRLESVRKLNQLIHWRFQLVSDSNTILTDRSHRPFKLARAPLPFVPTDIGSAIYVHNDNAEEADPIWASHHTTARTKAKTKTGRGVGGIGSGTGSHSGNTGGAGVGGSGGGGMVGGGSTIGTTKSTIPPELKRQLVEIGWVNDDGDGDEKEMWIRTPISMLPVGQVERLELQRSPSHRQHHRLTPQHDSPLNSPQQPNSTTSQVNPWTTPLNSKGAKPDIDGELLRRNSSSGGPTYAKRRAIFVPSLSLILKVLAMMVYDSNFSVAAAARDTLIDLMRNDSGLLLRPILDLFCDDQGQESPGARDSQKDVTQAVNIFTALLHAKYMLPPPMVHAIFNNLAGFLKHALKQSDPLSFYGWKGEKEGKGDDTLNNFALTIPIMARLAKHVGELSIREIRKSKMEHFLIPYGTLWFDHVGVPNGTMFPRGLGMGELISRGTSHSSIERGATRREDELNRKMIDVIMIRIAQNMMFVDMLRQNAQDVVLVRKSMPRFFVPNAEEGGGGTEHGRMLEPTDFVPLKQRKKTQLGRTGEAEKLLDVLSLTLARSYVTLVAQIFRCMSRNSNDREEIANFVDGLNRILLAHGNDIGIVGHVLIAFMIATARFRRLFTSGGGYALFMPGLARVYTEFHARIDITLAIEYAVYRFYTLHREAFLFQSLDAIALVAALPETDVKAYVARIYDLFYSLRTGVASTTLDPAGIQGVNQSQERQAFLFRAADETPQTFLTAIRRGDAQTNGQIFFEIPDPYENSRLKMEDFVKLFLTIIAHDPNILRAQHFMRIFRHIAPHLYNASTHARNVLQDGLVALSNILLRTFSKSKVGEAGGVIHVGPIEVMDGSEGFEKKKNASNPNVMRLDFLFALTGVGEAGCLFPPQMVQKAIEIAKLILRDAPLDMLEPLSTFFADLAKLVVLRGELSKPKYVKPFLQDITPIIRQYTTVLDLTSLFETLTKISANSPYTHDFEFARLLAHEVCSAGLHTCSLITSDPTNRNARFASALVSLLAESVFLRGADVIEELEKYRPSLYFLTRVVLPFVLSLKTMDELDSNSGRLEASHRAALTSSWIRLLLYAMTACRRSFQASGSFPLTRSKSREKRSDDEKKWQTHLSTYTVSLQIIKAIVIRAETEISTTSPDLWNRLSVFLKSALMDGSAIFALRPPGLDEGSPSPSPTPSPRGSIHINQSGQSTFFDQPGQSSPLAQPRVIDYALWSILEFLCTYRSPLRLQLRLFTLEKVVSLDRELKPQQRRMSPFTTPTSLFASPITSPMSRRVSASVFAKPRRSAVFSSAESSPQPSRSPSMIYVPSTPSIHLTPDATSPGAALRGTLETPPLISKGELRLPGYQYVSPTISPSRPGPGAYVQDGHGPRILHLGPTSPSALIPPGPTSPNGGGSMGVSKLRVAAQSSKIRSPALIRMTYCNIRAVQAFMGYDTQLPMPSKNAGLGISGIGMERDEVSVATLMRRPALEAILSEVKLLEEEFKEFVVRDIGAEKSQGDYVFSEKTMEDYKDIDETVYD